MAQLLDLSPEILHQIAASTTRRIYLYRLVLTCSRLYQIAKPMLYREFIQYRGTLQVRQFLRVILDNPELAARVKCVYVGEYREYNEDPEEDEDDDDDNDGRGYRSSTGRQQREDQKKRDASAVVSAIDNLHITTEQRETWIQGLNEQNHNALLAVLILSVPNLEKLSVTRVWHQNPFIQRALKMAIHRNTTASPVAYFNALSHVEYSSDYPEGCIYMPQIEHFFHVPSLRKLSVSGLSMHKFSWTPSLSSSNIEVLELDRGGIENRVWATLLKPLKNLKSLSFNPGNPKHVGYMDVDPSAIGQALSLVRKTLTSLCLTDFFLEHCNEILLGDLRDFPELKDIEVQLGMLIGTIEQKGTKALWEILPCGLETLTLYGSGEDREDAMDLLVEFVLKKEIYFPLLKDLTLRESFDRCQALEEVCSACNVSLERY